MISPDMYHVSIVLIEVEVLRQLNSVHMEQMKVWEVYYVWIGLMHTAPHACVWCNFVYGTGMGLYLYK